MNRRTKILLQACNYTIKILGVNRFLLENFPKNFVKKSRAIQSWRLGHITINYNQLLFSIATTVVQYKLFFISLASFLSLFLSSYLYLFHFLSLHLSNSPSLDEYLHKLSFFRPFLFVPSFILFLPPTLFICPTVLYLPISFIPIQLRYHKSRVVRRWHNTRARFKYRQQIKAVY